MSLRLRIFDSTWLKFLRQDFGSFMLFALFSRHNGVPAVNFHEISWFIEYFDEFDGASLDGKIKALSILRNIK